MIQFNCVHWSGLIMVCCRGFYWKLAIIIIMNDVHISVIPKLSLRTILWRASQGGHTPILKHGGELPLY